MGMKTTFIALLLFGFNALAAENACDGISSETIKHVSESLDYVGTKFASETAQCINANTDSEAVAACKKAKNSPNVRVINPSNEQYGLVKDGSSNSLNTSVLGFYLCYSGNDNDKKAICKKVIGNASLSTYNNGLSAGDRNFVTFKWIPKGNDGDCVCLMASTGAQQYNCANARPPAVAEAVSCSEEAGFISRPNRQKDEAACMCNPETHEADGPNSCKPKDSNTAEAKTENQTLQQCIEGQIAAAQQCVTVSKQTKILCEKYKEENSTVDGISSMAQVVFGGMQAKGAADAKAGLSSSGQACAVASLAASGMASLLSGFKDDCSKEQVQCTGICQKYTSQTLEQVCGHIANTLIHNTEKSDTDARYIANKQAELNKLLNPASEYCNVTALKENDLLASVLGGALNSQQAAQNCICATTTATGECMPSTEQCLREPATPGCNNNPYAINCALGAGDYASPNCVCLREPSSASCKTALVANVNGMGGAIKPGGSAGSGFAGTGPLGAGGGGFDSNIDLSSARGAYSGDATGKNPELSALKEGSPGGGGGPGGSSGSGSSGGSENAVAAEQERSGLGGAFSSLKSMMGAVFGGGKNANNNAKSKSGSGGVQFDPDKFKNPKGLRGVAGGTGFGSKNMDIFKMIKVRHADRDKAGRFFDPSYK